MAERSTRALVESLVSDLRRASFTIHARFRQVLGVRGLSMGQFVVLRTLVGSGPGTTKDLSKSMGVTTGNITGLVDKLEAEGLVLRERSKKDRRVVYLEATKKGRSLMEELRDAVIAETAKTFEDWATSDLRRLDQLLRRVIEAGGCAC